MKNLIPMIRNKFEICLFMLVATTRCWILNRWKHEAIHEIESWKLLGLRLRVRIEGLFFLRLDIVSIFLLGTCSSLELVIEFIDSWNLLFLESSLYVSVDNLGACIWLNVVPF
ncbi:hypothetical protein LINPERPRIM_LOCUS5712 [Linum perenne]